MKKINLGQKYITQYPITDTQGNTTTIDVYYFGIDKKCIKKNCTLLDAQKFIQNKLINNDFYAQINPELTEEDGNKELSLVLHAFCFAIETQKEGTKGRWPVLAYNGDGHKSVFAEAHINELAPISKEKINWLQTALAYGFTPDNFILAVLVAE